MKRVFETYGLLFTVAGAVIALDQWTKWIVRTSLPLTGTWLPESLEWLSPYARFVHWQNTGAAFGMFQNGSMIFAALAFVVIGAIIYYFPQVEKHDWTLRLAMSMQLGGASGNLIDRLLHNGQVTDFISVGTFPVFNIADASISVGTVILLLGVYLQERAAKKESLSSSNKPSEATSE
ncbi:MAG: signal peptidase II [Anaerolineales bacterium]|nr:signal peptidase II [Anaerolineales bacterium]